MKLPPTGYELAQEMDSRVRTVTLMMMALIVGVLMGMILTSTYVPSTDPSTPVLREPQPNVISVSV